MISKIFDLSRLEDEIDFLTAQSEKERQRRSTIKFWHVFRSKEIRMSFLVGGGLLVNVYYETVFAQHYFVIMKGPL